MAWSTVTALSGHAALGDAPLFGAEATATSLTLAAKGQVAPLWISADDWPGVKRAAGDLQSDLERVTGLKPSLNTGAPTPVPTAVLVGTIGHSALIDQLVAAGKIDASALRGKWEEFVLEVVEHPLPGIDRALVIVGSDKRGTIYGLYEISQQAGVSPWYWWGDVPVPHRDALYYTAARVTSGTPGVKYRGIFLNDEAPDLTNWVRVKFGDAPVRSDPPVPAGVANYGHEFYARVFELMLRLRANYLWPAMWNNAFNEDDPENARLADEYGIVMGTSHQEPMQRAQKEWDRRYLATKGPWNYAKDPVTLETFWRDGIRRNKNYENVVTLGLRGANDTEMAPGGPAANRALLEKIVERERDILRTEVNPNLTQVPQVWCLYKEVQEYYESGMRAPEDVTLLWAEDNWGNLRRLPTKAERARSGGAGVYYHFDYHGDPRSYQWLNTNPIPKIWEQMSLAKKYGADRVWIVNVGHLKGYEFPLEYFMRLAWDPARAANTDFNGFTKQWATRDFGSDHAAEIADIVEKYSKYNGRRKPELLAPDTYSLTDYGEAENVVADYDAIAAQAAEISRKLPAEARDAFYGLVLFPAKASALLNELYVAAGRNALYSAQGRQSANDWAEKVHSLFAADTALMADFNGAFAQGRWAHFMDQTHLGYAGWRDPPANNLDHLKLTTLEIPDTSALGVAVEGSTAAWPGSAGDAILPAFDAFNRQRHFIEVFRRGKKSCDFSAQTSAPWIELSTTQGRLGDDVRIWVNIDWSQVPRGKVQGTITLQGAAITVTVKVEVLNPTEITREMLDGFVEGSGVVSIEPEHYTKNLAAGLNRWMKIEDYGRTLSGMRAEAPVDRPPAIPGRDSPCLEYRMYLFKPGPVEVTAITAPTMNFVPDRGLSYAVSFDDEAPQTVVLVPPGYQANRFNPDWAKVVAENARYGRSQHELAQPGYHTLKIWMIDPAVVMQKLVVNLGGLKPSYLGPPESFHGPVAGKN